MKYFFFTLPKNAIIVCLFCYAPFNGATLYAQNLVARGLDSVKTILNIKYEAPEDFMTLDIIQIWDSGYSLHRRTTGFVFESKDKQCKVLYDAFPLYPDCPCSTHREVMHREIKKILDTGDFALNDYLRILPYSDAQMKFNADSVFIYELPSRLYYVTDDRYNHCTRMIISKHDRSTVELVWFFTDEGKKTEKEYMLKTDKHIWYLDGDCNVDQQRWDKSMISIFFDNSNEGIPIIMMDERNPNRQQRFQ